MIEKSTIHIESRDSKVPSCTLAPFGAKEVAQHFPIPETSLRYELDALRQTCAGGDVELFMQGARLSSTYHYWGLYRDRVSTATFIGTAGMSDVRPNFGNNRSPSCLIMPESARGKGYGTAALLGLSAYSFNKDGHGLLGGLSERNKGSIGIMKALGFTYLRTMRHYKFMGGEKSQFWVLMCPDGPDAKHAARLSGSHAPDLKPGWEIYLERRQRARIKQSGKLLKIS